MTSSCSRFRFSLFVFTLWVNNISADASILASTNERAGKDNSIKRRKLRTQVDPIITPAVIGTTVGVTLGVTAVNHLFQKILKHMDQKYDDMTKEKQAATKAAETQERKAEKEKEVKEDERKAEKEMKKQERKAEKEVKEQERKAEKEAKKQERKAEKEAKEQKREAATETNEQELKVSTKAEGKEEFASFEAIDDSIATLLPTDKYLSIEDSSIQRQQRIAIQ